MRDGACGVLYVQPVPEPSFTCPRCGQPVSGRFYGPCPSCREELQLAFVPVPKVVEVPEYEPKVNVTANAVALKDN